MKSPHKIRRIQRQFAQGSSAEPINIVSLIDIFAILVFYLLVSISALELHPNEQTLQLPRSTSQARSNGLTKLIVTRKGILLNDKFVMDTTEIMSSNEKILPKLRTELGSVALQPSAETGAPNRGEINILADKSITYAQLKRLMATSSDAQFARISLAVVQRPEEK